jgi:hypothetical protein
MANLAEHGNSLHSSIKTNNSSSRSVTINVSRNIPKYSKLRHCCSSNLCPLAVVWAQWPTALATFLVTSADPQLEEEHIENQYQ